MIQSFSFRKSPFRPSLVRRHALANKQSLPSRVCGWWKAIINEDMARGWESKSVEAQQDEAAAVSTPRKPRLTREAADLVREKENLRLALLGVQRQLEHTSGQRHRSMLERAADDLEAKLKAVEEKVRQSHHQTK
jgi:hypothetical protein